MHVAATKTRVQGEHSTLDWTAQDVRPISFPSRVLKDASIEVRKRDISNVSSGKTTHPPLTSEYTLSWTRWDGDEGTVVFDRKYPTVLFSVEDIASCVGVYF